MNESPQAPIRLWQFMGAIFLLIGAYLDNLRGPLLPVMARELNMDLSELGQFLAIGNLAAIVGTVLLIPIMNKISERKTGMFAILLILLGWVVIRLGELGYSKIYLAFFFGLCTSIFGALSNIFIVKGTPVKKQSRTLSLHQMMYGLGSIIAPFAVALSLTQGWPWSWLIIGLIPFAIAISITIKLGLAETGVLPEANSGMMSFSRQKTAVLFIFMGYVASEVACSMWMATYLNEKFHLPVSESSYITGGFFAVMMISRFFCFLFAKETKENSLLWLSLTAPLVIVTLVQLGAPYQILPLSGLFGPFFPIYFAKVSRKYKTEWRSMAIWLIVALQTSLMIMHLIVGKVADRIGSSQAYWFIPILLTITILFLPKILKDLSVSDHNV